MGCSSGMRTHSSSKRTTREQSEELAGLETMDGTADNGEDITVAIGEEGKVEYFIN